MNYKSVMQPVVATNYVSKLVKFSICAVVALTLGACASEPKNIYYWGDYQQSVYQDLNENGTTPLQLIDGLRKDIEIAQQKNLVIAPGVHAQLAKLYLDVGSTQEAMDEFAIEKQLYPESAAFIDYLLNKQLKDKK